MATVYAVFKRLDHSQAVTIRKAIKQLMSEATGSQERKTEPFVGGPNT